MNEVITCLKERRSCRAFKPEMITDAELSAVVEAGTYAPTGMNKQSPRIIVITNKEMRDAVAEENRKIGQWPEGFDPFYGAPVILLVIAEKNNFTHVYDGSLVIGNMLNAAHSIGLGSIWIHRAKEEIESDFGKQLLASLGIEGDFEGIGHVALGYQSASPKPTAPRREDYIYYIR